MMHNLDHRGVAGIIAGSVLADVVDRHVPFGTTKQERMNQVNSLKDKWFREHKVSSEMPTINLANLQWGGQKAWAELHGTVIKAANTRHLIPFIDHLAASVYTDLSSQWDKSVCKVCASLCKVYHILYGCDHFLSQRELADMQSCLYEFGVHFMVLRQLSQSRSKLFFHVTPKVHQMQHLVMQSRLINSRFTQCYCNESMMQRYVKMYKASCSGPYQDVIVYTVCLKYLCAWSQEMDL